MIVAKLTDNDITITVEKNDAGNFDVVTFSEYEQEELSREENVSLSDAFKIVAKTMVAEAEGCDDSPYNAIERTFQPIVVRDKTAR